MKSVALALSTLAALVVSQDVSSLPSCGQGCANDMLVTQAEALDCAERDLACLCQNRDFTYGLRDCSAATCSPDEARQIVEFGLQICRDAGVEITAGSEGGDGQADGQSPTPTGTGVAPSQTGTNGAPGADGGDGAPGAPSADGGDGAPTVDDSEGTDGGQGVDGTDGDDSTDGTGGTDGTDGGDGADGGDDNTTTNAAAMSQNSIAPVACLIAAGLMALML